MKVQLTASGKKYLNDNFTNGSYVEGFTFLTAEDEDGISLSVPFLGFYGDWGALDLYDADPGSPVQQMLGTALVDLDNAGSGYFVGVNNTSQTYNESKMAYAPRRGNRQLSARISFLRNATDVQQTITDEKGNVVFDTGNLGWHGRPTVQSLRWEFSILQCSIPPAGMVS